MWRLLLFILLVFVGILFGYFNFQQVQLSYYFGTLPMPLAGALLGAFLVGALLGLLTGVAALVRVRNELRKSRRQMQNLQQELTNLRALPVRD